MATLTIIRNVATVAVRTRSTCSIQDYHRNGSIDLSFCPIWICHLKMRAQPQPHHAAAVDGNCQLFCGRFLLQDLDDLTIKEFIPSRVQR